MNKTTKSIFATAISGLALIAGTATLTTSCGSGQSSAADGERLSGSISLSGAFALYPLAVQWADEFRKLHPDVRIDLSAGGAGKGIADALADVVDLGMVSREIEDEELAKGAVPFAVAKDAVVATVNATSPNLDALLKRGLTQQVAVGLWITGQVKTWGQLTGSTSADPVNVYTRSDACGAAGTWAKWLGKKQDDLLGTAVYGDPGVAQAVQKDVNGIGLVNIGFAYDSKTHKPADGIVVAPLDVNNNGQIDPEEDFYDTMDHLSQAIADGLYPAPPARSLYLVTHGNPSNPIVKAFLSYVLTDGQKQNAPHGYIPVALDVADQQLKRLE